MRGGFLGGERTWINVTDITGDHRSRSLPRLALRGGGGEEARRGIRHVIFADFLNHQSASRGGPGWKTGDPEAPGRVGLSRKLGHPEPHRSCTCERNARSVSMVTGSSAFVNRPGERRCALICEPLQNRQGPIAAARRPGRRGE